MSIGITEKENKKRHLEIDKKEDYDRKKNIQKTSTVFVKDRSNTEQYRQKILKIKLFFLKRKETKMDEKNEHETCCEIQKFKKIVKRIIFKK